MTLFKEWRDLIENQTEATFKNFWEEYSGAETRIYSSILDNPEEVVSGTLGELAEKYETRPVIFMGFLDGINTSLRQELDFENFDESSQVTLDIDLEKLYFNMLAADADYLYSLPQWDRLLTAEKRQEITKAYKKSKTVVKGKKIGRNDPCPCGSGKKYRKVLRTLEAFLPVLFVGPVFFSFWSWKVARAFFSGQIGLFEIREQTFSIFVSSQFIWPVWEHITLTAGCPVRKASKHSSQPLLFTYVTDYTTLTFRLPRVAAITSVKNKTMMSSGPTVLRQYLHQRQFCFQHVFFLYQSNPIRNPKYMGVHRDTLMTKPHCQHDISSFPTYARKLNQSVIIFGYLPIVLFYQHLCQRQNIFGLCFIHANPLDHLRDIFLRCFCQSISVRIFRKKILCHYIHTFICRLCR